MSKHLSAMNSDELDDWCKEVSGTVIIDRDNNAVYLLVKERSKGGVRKYKMRLVNLTYQTIGTCDETKIWHMLRGEGERNQLLEVVSRVEEAAITADDFNYGQTP
jgi:hypothetical protein